MTLIVKNGRGVIENFKKKQKKKNSQNFVALWHGAGSSENLKNALYNFLLFLSGSMRPVLVSNRKCRPNWQERILATEMPIDHCML